MDSGKKGPRSLREALEGKLSEEDLALAPRAFDTVGDIAVLNFDEEFPAGKKTVVAESLLETFKNIHVVAEKESKVDSEYRVPTLKVLAGEQRTETIHTEYGYKLKLDVSDVYFSPRLGTERMRVASQVRDGESVLVLFAGVGPYAIAVARKAKPSKVVAIELNPRAVEYMRDNVRLNKVSDRVEVIEGDARDSIPGGEYDRILMPLPKDAGDFLEATIPCLKKGGVIHFYSFAHDKKEAIDDLKDKCSQLGYRIKVLEAVECGPYSPCLTRTCIDFTVDA